MDETGRPCVVPKDDVTATLTDPSGQAVPTQLQEKGRGLWEISYSPEVTGNHRLEVKVNLMSVAGSPFDVTVQSRDTPVLTIGEEGNGEGELLYPNDIAVDMDGNIAVVERGNERVQIFDAKTVLQDGRMVVADSEQQCCLLLQPDGSLIRDIGKGHLQNPQYIAVDESRGLLFVTDYSTHKVFVFDLEGKLKFSFGKVGENEGELEGPTGITVDPAGNIVVVNCDNGRLQVFGPDGTYLRTVATVKGGDPLGIALTPDNHILVAVACFLGHCVELYRYK
ncbi:tripartite motif-containing protein 2-like [Branchiostoma floridae]|uniref:Tripartite motif-containing protein 2-like n=1 Tax=Branchiostoma floridae TaxID=7739 RepID=A0A9J7N635_BRAFL|nr:tripartite motif-containing protein 2-like [Branchiostoma floridae]